MKRMKSITLLLAGSFFLSGCFGGKVKSGVRVNGVGVGGLTYTEAEEKVRAGFSYLPLVIHTPCGDFEAELDYTDDVEEILRMAKRGTSHTAIQRREWIFAEHFLDMVCRNNVKEAVDATLSFDENGFSYTEGECGIACEYSALLDDVVSALKGGETEVTLSCREVEPAVTEKLLRERTQLLAQFSTKYDASNRPRSNNIALAAGRIAGTVIESGEEFSFNEVVGARTAENGFEEANIILDGEFVPGVGGGVCQASTTLFGAALRAGLEIVESRPHSLAVGYVAPSQDAMVSAYSDLRFRNPYLFPVYLLCGAENGVVTFYVYGMSDGRSYKVESKVLFRVDPPSVKIVEGKENRIVRAEKAGLASESYLLVYEGENLLSRTLIRRDTYACVQGIEERVPVPETPAEILEGEN